MEKKKLLLTIALLSVLASPIFASSNAKTPVKNKSLQSSVSDNWAVLGAPTLYATRMPTSSLICMNTQDSTIGTSPQAGFNFTSQANNSAISASLNLGLSAESVEVFTFFNGSANASFVATTKNTAYTLNFVYLYTYSTDAKLSPATYGNANLSSSGQSALAAGQAAFFTSCGDSFVSNLNAGVVLAVNVGVNFKSKLDTYNFQESASLSGASLPTILQSIEAELKNQGSTATISVSALQNGGTPESMQNIFINPETGNFNTMFCNSESVQNCQVIIDGINRYALGLPSQVQNDSGMIYNNLYFFNPVLNSYSSLGITVPSPQPLSDAVQTAQNTILEQLTIYKNRIAALNTYQQNSLPILPDVKSFIASQVKNLNSRVSYINSKAEDCFNAYADTCPAIVTQISNTFKSSPTIYGFDKVKYGYLFDESWYYTRDGHTLNYLVPVSFAGIFANYSTDKKGNLDKTSKTSQAFYSEENGVKYVNQFVIRSGLFTYKCLPSANDSKFSSTRNFTCKGGLLGLDSFDAQFVKSVNPI